jgi:hypothetical protein
MEKNSGNDGSRRLDKQDSTSTIRSFQPRPTVLTQRSQDEMTIDESLKRTNSDPLRSSTRFQTESRRAASCDQKLVPYLTAPYLNSSQADVFNAQSPGMTNVHLTVVNKVETPTPIHTSPLSPGPQNIRISKDNQSLNVVLNRPNQIRAFSRRAYAYQKRQWFNNICCVMLCPFLMVFFAFLLRLLVSRLTDFESHSFNFQYCSNFTSTNQQNWPIYNTSAVGIARLNSSQVPLATKDIRAVNFMSRLGLVDLAGRDPIAQLSSAAVAGSLPCVQWFGRQYPTGRDEVYEATVEPLNYYSTRDSLYSSQILSGWLDVLNPTRGGTELSNPFARQALSLTRTFVSLQTRPWALVGNGPNVDPVDIGTAPKEPPYSSANEIPGRSNPYFKSAGVANGILDTIEPRVYVTGSSIPPQLTGYQKVPFFETGFTTEKQLNEALYKAVQEAILRLSQIPPVEDGLTGLSGDLAAAQAFFNIQGALEDLPYGAVYFKELDHTAKNYSFVLQFGANGALEDLSGFPTAGFRRMIQQSQLTNGILRFSNSSRATAVITQGTRAFPYIEPPTVSLPFGSIIGRLLYPLGISFLLPIFTLALVRDKETRVIVMLRMVR